MRVRSFASIATALICFSLAAQAEEDLQWFGYSEKHGAALIYGVPETSFAPLAFNCETETGTLTFTVEFEPVDAADGVEVTVYLQAGDVEIAIETIGQRLEMGDLFILQGSVLLDDRFENLIASRGALIVTIEDGAMEYPLDGARKAASRLLKTCRSS